MTSHAFKSVPLLWGEGAPRAFCKNAEGRVRGSKPLVHTAMFNFGAPHPTPTFFQNAKATFSPWEKGKLRPERINIFTYPLSVTLGPVPRAFSGVFKFVVKVLVQFASAKCTRTSPRMTSGEWV